MIHHTVANSVMKSLQKDRLALIIYILVSLVGLKDCLTEIKVGVIVISRSGTPYDVGRSGAAIQMAFERVNAELLNDDYKLVKIERHYGPECDAALAPGRDYTYIRQS